MSRYEVARLRLDEDLPRLAATHGVPGVSVAVLVDGQTVEGTAGVVNLRTGVEVTPDPAARTPNPSRYVGRYETGVARNDVTVDDDGRLWLTVTDRGDAVTLAQRAGIPDEPDRGELRQVDGDLFVLADADGARKGVVEFLETDAAGRARFLHSGRAAPRAD